MSAPTDNTTIDWMTLREVCAFFGGTRHALDKSTIYRWVREGKLAPPVRMSALVHRWKRSDCQEALERMQAAPTRRRRPPQE